MGATGTPVYMGISSVISAVIIGVTVLVHRVVAPERRPVVVRTGVVYLLVLIATGGLVVGGNLAGEPCGPSALEIVRDWSPSAFEPTAQPMAERCIEVSRAQLVVAASAQNAASLVVASIAAQAVRRERVRRRDAGTSGEQR